MGSIPEGVSRPRTVLVVGVDLTAIAPHLLNVALDLVPPGTRGEIHVVTVLRPQSIPADMIGAIPTPGPSHELAMQRARGELEALCTSALRERDGVVVDVVMHVRMGRAADGIERVAEEVAADVIVVEAHDRKGIARLLHRSVSAELARNAPCSVLTVRTRRTEDRDGARAPLPGVLPSAAAARSPRAARA